MGGWAALLFYGRIQLPVFSYQREARVVAELFSELVVSLRDCFAGLGDGFEAHAGGVFPDGEYTRKVPLPSTLVGTDNDAGVG